MKKIKMFGKKSVSSILYWLFILCFVILTVSIFRELYLYFNGSYSTVNIEGLPYPLVVINLFVLLPKAILFFLLIMIFKSFKSDIIFTRKTLTYLNIFTVFSICMPIIKALFDYSSINTGMEFFLIDVLNTMLPNLLLGVFAAFIAAIFKQGFHLQTENNLTI